MQLVRSEGGAAALHALPMVACTPATCAAAIRALQQRRNLQGVRAVLQHARDTGAAAGPAGRQVWRAAIAAYGGLGRPKDARRVFVEMRESGAWSVEDVHTVNLLLNALAGSIEVQFVRCGMPTLVQHTSVQLRPPTAPCTLLEAGQGPRLVDPGLRAAQVQPAAQRGREARRLHL